MGRSGDRVFIDAQPRRKEAQLVIQRQTIQMLGPAHCGWRGVRDRLHQHEPGTQLQGQDRSEARHAGEFGVYRQQGHAVSKRRAPERFGRAAEALHQQSLQRLRGWRRTQRATGQHNAAATARAGIEAHRQRSAAGP